LPRTLLVALGPAAVITTAWLRLENPIDLPLRSVAIAALALLPALVRPLAGRLVTAVLATAGCAWIAFALSPLHPRHFFSAFGTRFANGFLDFYDVRTPFDPRVHAEMRGVLLAAIFGFTLATALAIAARRPLAAVLLAVVAAGWPATLRGPSGALAVGALILLAVLVILAGLSARGVPRAVVPAAAALALAGVAASTSAAVAKGALVGWQRWDFYNAAEPPVSVSFVWNAQYGGIHWPRKETTVLEAKAPPRSLFWRAAVLDEFTGTRWVEEPSPLRGDALEPKAAEELRQDVRVLALSDTRLVGASVPVRFDVGDAPVVSHAPGFAELPSGLTHGFTYTVWSDAFQPSPAQLGRSRASYPIELTEPGTFLDVAPGVTMPSFGRARHLRSPVGRTALQVAHGALTPYAAAAALERWFTIGGGFTYTDSPPSSSLAAFILRTRTGYCQHFAGAMALMLRYLGIPARVAVGFSSGRYDAKRGVWSVNDHDAHAWVEAWFRGYGWLPFDPTPAGRPERGELSAPYARVARGGGTFQGRGAQTGGPGQNGAQTGHRHGETSGTGVPTFTSAPSGQGSHWDRSLLLLVLIVVGGLAALLAGAKLLLRRARYLTRDPRSVAAACRRELADYLVDQQIDAARSATLHELGALVRHELAVEPDAFVAAATAARFGPPAGAAPAAREARQELRALRRRMRVRLRTRDRIRGLLSLRSLGFTG
jgi:transglutaminase-like putative cysteine protease